MLAEGVQAGHLGSPVVEAVDVGRLHVLDVHPALELPVPGEMGRRRPPGVGAGGTGAGRQRAQHAASGRDAEHAAATHAGPSLRGAWR